MLSMITSSEIPNVRRMTVTFDRSGSQHSLCICRCFQARRSNPGLQTNWRLRRPVTGCVFHCCPLAAILSKPPAKVLLGRRAAFSVSISARAAQLPRRCLRRSPLTVSTFSATTSLELLCQDFGEPLPLRGQLFGNADALRVESGMRFPRGAAFLYGLPEHNARYR